MGTDANVNVLPGLNEARRKKRVVNYRDYYGTWQDHPEVAAKLDAFEQGAAGFKQTESETTPITLGTAPQKQADGTYKVTQTDYVQADQGIDRASLTDEQRANLDQWEEQIYDPGESRYGPSAKYVGLMDKAQGMTYPQYQEKVSQAEDAKAAAEAAKAQKQAHYKHLQDVLMAQREAIASERGAASEGQTTQTANDDEARAKRRLLARMQGGAGTTRTSATGASGTAKVKKRTLGGA